MLILVTYDLKRPLADYEKLYDLLKSANRWWHFISSTWLISIDDNSPNAFTSWYQRINELIYQNDRVLVMKIQPNTENNGWLPQNAWDWIAENINK